LGRENLRKAIKFASVNLISTKHYEDIADGLAERGYACIDDFLTLSEVNAILASDEFRSGLLHFKRAGTGRDKLIHENVRGDYIQWIDSRKAPEELVRYFAKLNGLITYLNHSLFLSLKDYEVHRTIYPAGSYYARHLDQFKAADHRKLSVICYLNIGWKEELGGQLRMHLPEGPRDFYPVAGRLICFRSDQVEHEVVPALRDRLSLTGWILDQVVELGHL
jgi:SM-20-related protein